MDYIKTYFDKLGIKITPDICRKMHALVISWETRGTTPLTLNSQLLGTHTIVFTATDRSALFHLVGITEPDFKRQITAVSRATRPPPIDTSRRVSSDPFNLLSVWLLHRAYEDLYQKDQHLCTQFMLDVAKYLHYKFFTSLINHYFPHGADDGVMLAVLTSLNRRFDIVTHGTWKATIEARSKDLISQNSVDNIHWKTITTFTPDQLVLYVVTDTQTRLRDKIGNIRDQYYAYHKDGTKIASTSATGTDIDGEKILIHRSTTLDTALASLLVELLSVNSFVRQSLVNDMTRQVNDVSPTLLRLALETLSQQAAIQMTERKIDDVKTHPDGTITYVGVRALVREIVLSSFEYCAKNNVDMQSKVKVFNAIRNRYTSSQIKDQRILGVKTAIEQFIDDNHITSRPATKSSLRLAIILYVLAKCLLTI